MDMAQRTGNLGEALVMMTESDRIDGLLKQMRAAFEERRWDETIQLFGELSKFSKLPRNARIEATCLTARSMTSMQNRSGARNLLSNIASTEHTKPAAYAHLAQAYMDLKNYREVARLCQRVIALEEAS